MVSHSNEHRETYLAQSLGAHAAYTLHYHLVWSVRARRPLLSEPIRLALRDLLLTTAAREHIEILAMHIALEHVHVLLSLRPDRAVAAAVHLLKGASARRLRQQFPALRDTSQHTLWGTGYFIRSLGNINVAQAKAYLDRQNERHA